MAVPELLNALPCNECGAPAGEKCRRLDGAPRCRNHYNRTPPAPCGTYGGYQRHVKARETPCEACAEASRRYMATYRERNPKSREKDVAGLAARNRAIKRLVERHRQEFDRLVADERGNGLTEVVAS